MKRRSLWRAMTHSVVVVLVLSTCFALFVPAVQASAEWIGQSGGSTANAINYTNYDWINSDQAEIRPFSVATTSITVYQDFWKSDFTSGVDLDQARLYYKTNSSSFGTANDESWTVVNGTITAIGSSNDDRATFTLSATAGTDIMFYIRYTDNSADAYGFPGASSPWTSLPSSQSQTYKIRFNSSSTYNAKRIDGLMHDWQDNEKLGTVGSTNYYLTWDDANLYVRISGGFANSDQIQIAIDTDPGTNNVTGSSATAEFSKATFAGYLTPDYLIRSNGTTNLEKFTRSGTNWGSGSSIYSAANLWRSGDTAEIRIPRSDIGSLSTASTFGVYFWLANSGGDLYVSYGTDNPTSCTTACRMRTETGFTSSGSGITLSSDQKADHNNSETRTLGITSLRHLYVSNGTATAANNDTSVGGNVIIASGASLSLSGTSGNDLLIGGDWTNNGGFTANSRAVTFNGTTTVSGSSTTSFDYVTIAGTLTGHSASMNVAKDWTNDGTFNASTGTVTFNGSGAQAISGATTFYNLTVNNTAGSPGDSADVDPDTAIVVNNTLNVTDGQFQPHTGSTFKDVMIGANGILRPDSSASVSVGGNWTNSINAGFSANNGTVTFNGSAGQTIGGGAYTTFDNLTIDNSSGVGLGKEQTVNGTLTLTSGNLSAGVYALYLDGPVTCNGNSINSTGNVDYKDAGNQDVCAGSYGNLQTLTSGIKTLQGNATAGYVAIGGGTTLAANNFAMTVANNWNNYGTFNAGTGTVTFNGTAGDQTFGGNQATAFNNLIIRGKGDGVTTTNSVVVIPTSNTPTVTGTLTNNGTLKQTNTVNANSTVTFLNIATNKYYGVEIASGSTALGNTTVTISGNQICPQANGYPVKRSFNVTPTAQASANIKFYYQQNEMQTGQTYSSLNVWNYHSGAWNSVTRGDDSGSCNTNAIDCYVQGNNISNYSPFALKNTSPQTITLADFYAVQQGDFVLVTWETNSELENRGFNLYRGVSDAGWDTQLNDTLIPSQSQGNPGGFIYTWEDRLNLVPGTTYYYWLEDVDIYGVATLHGPVNVDFAVPTAVTLSGIDASPAGPGLPAAGALLALLAPLAGALTVRRRRV